jgi:translation initiation factor 5
MENNSKLYLTSDECVLFDHHYRYQISPIQTSSMLKKGTHITILDNFVSFCNELLFDNKILIKVIGKSLSCKSGIDKTGKYYLQGNYTPIQVKDVIYTFIKTYLLCVNCDKPEVNLKHKNNKIKQKCRACGNNTYLLDCKEEIINIFKTV